MVLQRGKPNRIWGWTKAGQSVHVDIAGQTANAVAGADGNKKRAARTLGVSRQGLYRVLGS